MCMGSAGTYPLQALAESPFTSELVMSSADRLLYSLFLVNSPSMSLVQNGQNHSRRSPGGTEGSEASGPTEALSSGGCSPKEKGGQTGPGEPPGLGDNAL